MRGFNPNEILRQIHTRRISVLVSVPQILEILRAHLEQTFPELKQLRPVKIHWLRRWWRYRKVHRLFGWKFWCFIVGAAPLPADLEAFFSELGFLVIQGYGLTETAPIVTLNHPFHARKGTAGTPIAGVEVKIAPDGEILVRGDNVTSGYYQRPEETAQRLRRRLVPHRRHRQAGGERRAHHPRPQERNDRDARGPQRFSRGCRRCPQAAAGRARCRGDRNRPRPCGADSRTGRRCGRNRPPRQRRSWPTTSASARFPPGRTTNSRAPKAPANSSATRSPRARRLRPNMRASISAYRSNR